MTTWEEEVQKSVAEELSDTLDNQINSRSEIERKASQIIAADFIAASVITGLFADSIPSVFILLSLLSIALSIYYCIHVFVPKEITLGLGKAGASGAKGMSAYDYFETLISEQVSFIEANRSVKELIADDLEKALWFTLAGVLFFAAFSIELAVNDDFNASVYAFGILMVVVSVIASRRKAHKKVQNALS